MLIVGLQSAPREIDLFALTVHEIEVTTTLAHVCDVDLPESLQIISGSNLASIVLDRVIPFFERNPILSAKHADFETFAIIVRELALGHHRTEPGFRRLLELALSMNGGGRFRKVRWL